MGYRIIDRGEDGLWMFLLNEQQKPKSQKFMH
jgi:hypothetical protein